jgi:DNA-directed RNA polymerase specialized sigma24 family protein
MWAVSDKAAAAKNISPADVRIEDGAAHLTGRRERDGIAGFFVQPNGSALNRTRPDATEAAILARPHSVETRAFPMTTVSSIDVSTAAPEPAAAILSLAEAGAAIRALSVADKAALMKLARLYAKKTPYDHEDLLQEAVCRVLAGARAWPRHVAALPFLWGVVRSIAWEWKKELIERDAGAIDVGGEERRANASLDVVKVLAQFDDDPAAQIIVRGMMDGARGQELQEMCGLDKTDYESKRTKIRRRIEKLEL